MTSLRQTSSSYTSSSASCASRSIGVVAAARRLAASRCRMWKRFAWRPCSAASIAAAAAGVHPAGRQRQRQPQLDRRRPASGSSRPRSSSSALVLSGRDRAGRKRAHAGPLDARRWCPCSCPVGGLLHRPRPGRPRPRHRAGPAADPRRACSSPPGPRRGCSPSPAAPWPALVVASWCVTSANRMARIDAWLGGAVLRPATAPATRPSTAGTPWPTAAGGASASARAGRSGLAARGAQRLHLRDHRRGARAARHARRAGACSRSWPGPATGWSRAPTTCSSGSRRPRSWPGSSVQALINIGAVIGLLPVIGVPLPLVSCGGSALHHHACSRSACCSRSRAPSPAAARRCRPGVGVAAPLARRPAGPSPGADADDAPDRPVGPARRRRHGRARLAAARPGRLPAPARPATCGSPRSAPPTGSRRGWCRRAATRCATVPKVPFPRRPDDRPGSGCPARCAAPSARPARRSTKPAPRSSSASAATSRPRPTSPRAGGGIPIVVHEQNARPGLANRLGARLTPVRGHHVRRHARCRTPPSSGCRCGARSRLLDRAARRDEALARLRPADTRPTLLVTGGSLGAQRLNDDLRGAASTTCAPPACRCCTSAAWARSSSPAPTRSGAAVRRAAVLDRMDLAYAAADLVVGRAGANTVCELTAVGLPAVYVPLPIGNGEQRLNAGRVVAAGGGLLVDDAELTPAWVGRHPAAAARRRRPAADHGRRGGRGGRARGRRARSPTWSAPPHAHGRHRR